MTGLSRTERSGLCDDALLVGEDQPTLCEGWTVKDLVVHLLLREGSPAAAGIVVPWLSRAVELESRRIGRREFTVLVERLRNGPPAWSPYAVPKVDALLNTLEYFVHHEDIRRAQDGWEPRELSARSEDRLWRQIRSGAKTLLRGTQVGVTLERADTGEQAVVRAGEPMAVVRGRAGEVTLFVFGRKPQARVDLLGPDDAVAALRGTSLGI
jgi:uncharacterized protein (TIGR03085 family)